MTAKITSTLALAPRQTRGDETRRRIADAAIAEFKRVGVSEANIGNIAKAAGVSRPTFYFHFPTKEHILLELQRTLELPIIILLENVEGFSETLNMFVSGLMKARKSVGDKQLFSEMLLIYTKQAYDLPIDDQPLMLILAARFEDAAKKGELKEGIDPAKATLIYLTSVFGYFIGQGNIASDKESKEALQIISSLFMQ
jgi:AcrR family transcriptional regulator